MKVHIRRLPGLLYHFRYTILAVLFACIFCIYKLLHWRIICTNLEPWSHVNYLCRRFKDGEVTGDLCNSICGSPIHSLSCHSFHAGKEVVFTANHVDGTKMVFKSASVVEITEISDIRSDAFRSEDTFERIIHDHVIASLNISITKEEAKRLARFTSGEHAQEGTEIRKFEIRDLWYLLQDNEYLLTKLFIEKDVFPRLLGSCGSYFAVEYLKPAIEGKSFTTLFENSKKDSWSIRVRLANMILDLLSDLATSVNGGFALCDIKPSHFGISHRSGRIKFLDLDLVFPKGIADASVANNASCSKDSDCDLFDCKSVCNQFSKKCDRRIVNNNLQVVCEKIFLGWQITGKFITPGLLMSEHTPSQLVSLLRQCAEVEIVDESINSVQERLTAVMLEVDRVLAAAGYDYDNTVA